MLLDIELFVYGIDFLGKIPSLLPIRAHLVELEGGVVNSEGSEGIENWGLKKGPQLRQKP